MHTANNSYIEILKQSLTKKLELLDTIMALNVLQKDMLENPDLDPDELDENLNRKADLVEQLSKLDDGFGQIYDRVRTELMENRTAYTEDIAQMKRDITAIMDKSTAIQSQEKRNQVLMQQKFTSVKKQIKEVKKSRQAVNSYYRNMMKMGAPEAAFLDDKK
ncbi:MAG TPA: flagellin biosynthesis protein FlgN [Roseburia sp.]|nr:flagellin biosynthesis protein FlgN [Roseburia sp.]